MITNEQAAKMFEQPTIEAIPTGIKRIVIPAYGFAGGKDTKREEWGADGPFMEDVKGLEFHNPADKANQVLKQKDGVLLCYDAPGRKEKIETYLSSHPNTFKTANYMSDFIEYLKRDVVNEGGKADLWDSDINFASSLIGAPNKEDIKPGKIFTGAKKKEAVQAIHLPEGSVFEGATGQPQTAGEKGAYLIKDSAGMRMIQTEEFSKAYSITKIPNTMTKQKEMGD